VSRRRAIAAGLLILVVGITVWLRPEIAPPAADRSLALAARAPVPPPVLSVLRRACFDCHSNETHWPWYAFVPPASWLVAHDVKEGRAQLNFSRWGEYHPLDRADMLDEMCDLASTKQMPLWQYRLLHDEARLTDAEQTALCAWTAAEAVRLEQGGS
jgi:hypothetical protein